VCGLALCWPSAHGPPDENDTVPNGTRPRQTQRERWVYNCRDWRNIRLLYCTTTTDHYYNAHTYIYMFINIRAKAKRFQQRPLRHVGGSLTSPTSRGRECPAPSYKGESQRKKRVSAESVIIIRPAHLGWVPARSSSPARAIEFPRWNNTNSFIS
jgi:hypothetical protein